ncbi:hypothetical protein H8Z72_23340 (plasmid) [Xanthomonas citri pv. citri]|uniref:hypothetical protein n=1 Tax=Xanthomonas citri TaxID=346 RepID=UPI0019346081|nr:hypothetical protein [Xanthomonas citri]QRD62751.1 hypothetical protein H8Z74_22845 [Xanthomonas citri pv. citri]QRD67078.1 hypothetical protein H8Z73_22930 [Xanthomonas citri pv. citri]QRD71669.1 hypothetical protein H8Z72_23340 [Xanthomonas citri pv. citri]
MKHRTHKHPGNDRLPGTHDQQIEMFQIAVSDAEIEVSHRYTQQGMREELVASLKRQRKKISASFKRKKGRKKERKKALQYGLRMRERSTDRIVDYVPKPACSRHSEARIQGNEVSFTHDEIVAVHEKLLIAFREAFANNWASGNPRCIELVLWMTANRPQDPFSFETCCYLSNVDPDLVKGAILRKVRKRYTHELLHYNVFRQAIMDVERGNPEAIQWLNSEDTTEFSFLGLCKIFEFEPLKARASIRVPSADVQMVA